MAQIFHPSTNTISSLPTIKAIWGQKLIPGLLDRYLARTGYQAQQASAYIPLSRADNLFTLVPGDHGAHGMFDSRSRAYSPQLWLAKNRYWLLLASAVFGLLSRRRRY